VVDDLWNVVTEATVWCNGQHGALVTMEALLPCGGRVRLTKLTAPEFTPILGTFPLVHGETKVAALSAFREVSR